MDTLQDALIAALPEGLLVLDHGWRVLLANPAAAALLGTEPGALRGRVFGADEPLTALHIGTGADAVQAGALGEPRVWADATGRIFEAEAFAVPETGYAVLFRDVTGRRRAEQELLLRDRAVSAVAEGIVITDARLPDNPIIYANPGFERITGYAAHEVVGRNCRFLQGDGQGQSEVEEICAAIREGRHGQAVLCNYRKDGTLFWNELRISPVHDERGALTHFVGIQADITARKEEQDALLRRTEELEEAKRHLEAGNAELAEATQARDRFMATMSHEMRTPLNAVIGYAELLEMGIGGQLNEKQHGYLGRIRSTGRHLLDLINDVLDLARASGQPLELSLRPVALRGVIDEAVALVEPQAHAKGIAVEWEPGEGCPVVGADLRRLRQVLANLLSNAVKFTERGAVMVRCRANGDGTASVEVADTGIGIGAEQLPHVFDEFYQADSGLTRERGGSGLGLAIARRLAELMGGTVEASSRPGEGSVFTLTLRVAEERRAAPRDPARQPEALRLPAPARNGGGDGGGGALPVVVVFGDSGEALEELAQKLRFQVRVVGTTSAREVPALVRRSGASLVVLDVACSQGIGWKVAGELRNDPELDEVATLLLPCLPQTEDGGPAGALDLGWVALIPKPFTAEQLARGLVRARTDGGRSPLSDGGETPDVLVVDDDADARRIAAGLLTAAGARVREASDGEQGLVEMRSRRPDVAVVDLMMPVLDGFGVLAAMRADPALRNVPVVVLTAKDLSSAERAFLARTAEGVLQKGEQPLADVASLILRAAERPPLGAAAGG